MQIHIWKLSVFVTVDDDDLAGTESLLLKIHLQIQKKYIYKSSLFNTTIDTNITTDTEEIHIQIWTKIHFFCDCG